MDYQETLDAIVTKAEAIIEIKRHNLEPADFFAEVGDKGEYKGSEILDWLGY